MLAALAASSTDLYLLISLKGSLLQIQQQPTSEVALDLGFQRQTYFTDKLHLLLLLLVDGTLMPHSDDRNCCQQKAL